MLSSESTSTLDTIREGKQVCSGSQLSAIDRLVLWLIRLAKDIAPNAILSVRNVSTFGRQVTP